MRFLEHYFTEISDAVLNKVKDKFITSGSDETEVNNYLDKFNTLSKKNLLKGIDITSFKTLDDLKNTVDNVGPSKSEVIKNVKTAGADKVFENDVIIVIRPITHAASCKYGANTEWCTTNRNPTKFNVYTRAGALYYIIPKDGSDKTAIYKYKSGQMEAFDANDNPIDPKLVIRKYKIPVKILSGEPTHTFSWDSMNSDENIDVNDYNLKTLEGAPQKVGGDFFCVNNQLTTLEGAPREVGGNFSCNYNQLTTLEGAPTKVGRSFSCRGNQLTTLEGAPREVRGGFSCSINELTTLEGAPTKVGRSFSCSRNQLTTLEGAPKEVGGDFECYGNVTNFTEDQVRAVCNVKGNIEV